MPSANAGGVLDPHGLDGAVVGDRLDDQPVGQPVDRLGVQRVDHQGLGAAGQPRALAAGDQAHRVARVVAELARQLAVAPVVELAGQLVDQLVQAAAERDVELLVAAADRQHGHAALQRHADQRQGGGVALAVVQGALARRLAAVMVRLDVGRAAGQQQAVERARHRVRAAGRARGRDQERQPLDAGDDGVDVTVRTVWKGSSWNSRTQAGIPITGAGDAIMGPSRPRRSASKTRQLQNFYTAGRRRPMKSASSCLAKMLCELRAAAAKPP